MRLSETLGIFKQSKCHKRIYCQIIIPVQFMRNCNVITTRTSQLRSVAAKAHNDRLLEREP